MSEQTLYPGYNVMDESEAWDDHTREIVKKRLDPVKDFQYLTESEVKLLSSIAAVLVDDQRTDILAYIVSHIGNRLQSRLGESQRGVKVPPEAVLIRKGLAAINATAKTGFNQNFSDLDPVRRQTLLGRLERAEFPNSGPWQALPQQEFFKKILDLVVESYYSHPAVWSEVGYAGPAYPRGYVRPELNLADPWEARRQEAVNPKE